MNQQGPSPHTQKKNVQGQDSQPGLLYFTADIMSVGVGITTRYLSETERASLLK